MTNVTTLTRDEEQRLLAAAKEQFPAVVALVKILTLDDGHLSGTIQSPIGDVKARVEFQVTDAG